MSFDPSPETTQHLALTDPGRQTHSTSKCLPRATRQYAGRTADEIRARPQSQDRQEVRPFVAPPTLCVRADDVIE